MTTLNPDWPVFEFKGSDNNDPYSLMYELEPNIDSAGREYEMVTQCLEDDDFYQGLNMITVIKRKSDGKLFGYSWWRDNSKHGESDIESNGGQFGLECDVSAEDFDWYDDFVYYYVFQPVEPYSITAYRKTSG